MVLTSPAYRTRMHVPQKTCDFFVFPNRVNTHTLTGSCVYVCVCVHSHIKSTIWDTGKGKSQESGTICSEFAQYKEIIRGCDHTCVS